MQFVIHEWFGLTTACSRQFDLGKHNQIEKSPESFPDEDGNAEIHVVGHEDQHEQVSDEQLHEEYQTVCRRKWYYRTGEPEFF